MAEITAAMVKELREKSGLPMMDCKQALNETQGDMQAAMDLLRKKGAAAAEKKVGRETKEGRIGKHRDAHQAALVEVQCETAPVANNPIFREMTDALAQKAAHGNITDSAQLAEAGKEVMHDAVNKLRENMQIGRIIRETGKIGMYLHHDGKKAAMVVVEGEGADDILLSEICMHITFAQPGALSREHMPAAEIEREQSLAREMILQSGKPANLVEKILGGKMDRWFGERVLLEQPFVKDDKKTVGQVAKENNFKILRFHYLAVGAGSA
jgi:elongation factor Ts